MDETIKNDKEGASLDTDNSVEEVQKTPEEIAEEEARVNADLLGFIMHDNYSSSSAPQENKAEMDESIEIKLNPDPQKVKLTRKQKKRQKYIDKVRKRFFKEKDIKYRGIFSYRYLRLFAWITLALSQIVIMHNYTETAFPLLFQNKIIGGIISSVSDVSMPLFLLATFAYILNRHTSYKAMMLFYLFSYLGVALFECFVIHRYLMNILTVLGSEEEAMAKILGLLVGQKIQFNIFCDIFMLILFNFFVNYTPKKFFSGKKIYIFRALSLIPLLFAFGIYIVRILSVYGKIELSVYVYPFLTTKSPFVYIIFVIISLWIKHRERIFVRFGATRAEYGAFLKTNRNSLSFSLTVSKLFFIFSIIDIIATIIAMAVMSYQGFPDESLSSMVQALGFGQCVGLMIAIPAVLLFSYTKKEQYQQLDMLLPFVGIALILLIYVEGTYDIIMGYLNILRGMMG